MSELLGLLVWTKVRSPLVIWMKGSCSNAGAPEGVLHAAVGTDGPSPLH